MGEFGDTVLKHYRVKEVLSDLDSKLRINETEIGKEKAVLPLDVPDALRSTREALDLVVACMVALLLVILVITIFNTIVTRLVDLVKQRKQMKANFGQWRSKSRDNPPFSQRLAQSPLLPLTSPKSPPLPPTGPYRAVPKPPDSKVPPKMVPPSAPPAEQDFPARAVNYCRN